MKPSSPCKPCTQRHPACHSECDEYQKYLTAKDDFDRLLKEGRQKYQTPYIHTYSKGYCKSILFAKNI